MKKDLSIIIALSDVLNATENIIKAMNKINEPETSRIAKNDVIIGIGELLDKLGSIEIDIYNYFKER